MTSFHPEIEIVDRATSTLRYLEHGWPSDLCRWHAHDEFELHLTVATRGKAFVGDYIGAFKPGSLFLTGPHLPHNWVTDAKSNEPVPLRDMAVQFDQRSLDKAKQAFPEFREIEGMLAMSRSGVEFVDFDPAISRPAFERIRETRGFAQVLAFLSLLDLLNKHPNKMVLSDAKVIQKPTDKKYTKIGEVIDYVINNYAEELSVTAAAAMAGMSETSFSRNFQASTGNRFTEFVNRIRIGQACILLFETEEKISSICYDVGFNNLANFNRHFTKMKNMTPSEYRATGTANLMLPNTRFTQ